MKDTMQQEDYTKQYAEYIKIASEMLKANIDDLYVVPTAETIKRYVGFIGEMSTVIETRNIYNTPPVIYDRSHNGYVSRGVGIGCSLRVIRNSGIYYCYICLPVAAEKFAYFVFKKGELFKAARLHQKYVIQKDNNKHNIYIPDDLKNILLKNSVHFMSAFKSYKHYGVWNRRGILLHGPAGNGKSTIAKWISNQLRSDYALLTSTDISNIINNNVDDEENPLIYEKVVIIDDIDLALMNRSSGQPEIACTFLSMLDGGQDDEKPKIRIFTTNESTEDIDPAFLRPGRIDLSIRIENPTREHIEGFINQMWHKDLLDVVLNFGFKKFIDACEGFSFADIDAVKNLMVLNKIDYGGFKLESALADVRKNKEDQSQANKMGFMSLIGKERAT